MGWADEHIERLVRGETVSFRPRGNSMEPRVRSGQLCTVEPLRGAVPGKGDVVLCRVGRAQYLHLVKAFDGDRFQIGNNHGRVNGWIGLGAIYGRLVRVE